MQHYLMVKILTSLNNGVGDTLPNNNYPFIHHTLTVLQA